MLKINIKINHMSINVAYKSFFVITLLLFVLKIDAQHSIEKQILWTADFSSDGKMIAIGGNVDKLMIYKTKNLDLIKSFPIANTITCASWHPNLNLLAVGTQGSSDSPFIIHLDTGNKKELSGVSPDGARGVDWNNTGEYLAIADNDGQISIYDIEGRLIKKINHENTKGITALDWHPKKNIFVTVGDKIRIFDIDGTSLKTISHRKEGTLLLSVAWHPSGTFFATGDYGEVENGYPSFLQFWSENGDLLMTNAMSKGEYRNIRWNTKGTKLATASDALRIWDIKGNLLAEGVSEDYLWGLSWHKNGRSIVTSSKKQEVVLWDSKGKMKQVLK
jgi:WD40 repeat protein